MAELNRSWEPEFQQLEQELLNQDSTDRQHADTVAAQAESNAKGYADTVAGQAETNAKSYADTKKQEAISAAASDATSKANTAETNAKSYADTKKQEAISAAASDATSKANTAETNAKSYADTKKQEAISAAASDATNKANTAETNAKSHVENSLLKGLSGYNTYNNAFAPGGESTDVTRGFVNQVSEFSVWLTVGARHSGRFGDAFVRAINSRAGEESDSGWNMLYSTQNLTLPEDKAAGAVGSYALLNAENFTGELTPGSTHSGSTLKYANTNTHIYSGSRPSGTWRAMGTGYNATGERKSLFLRIA